MILGHYRILRAKFWTQECGCWSSYCDPVFSLCVSDDFLESGSEIDLIFNSIAIATHVFAKIAYNDTMK